MKSKMQSTTSSEPSGVKDTHPQAASQGKGQTPRSSGEASKEHSREHPPSEVMGVRVHLCTPQDQERFLPKRIRSTAMYWPAGGPIPREGEVVYLSSTSAWAVVAIIYEWRENAPLRVEVWLEHVTSSRHMRPSGFALTQ